jgi:NADPH:quinone reductase-like Zn-dependent oxidoreductase
MMKAARLHTFGPPSVIVIDELPRPTPGHGEVLVRVAAAGVGPWDALIREHKSVVQTPLPLILGSDVSGVIEAIGPGVSAFQAGDEIYGVTNPDFCGAYTEYAIASAAMVARKPQGLSHVEAASVPVVAESWPNRTRPRRSGKCRRIRCATGEPSGSAGVRDSVV